jgi:hypothetical protein
MHEFQAFRQSLAAEKFARRPQHILTPRARNVGQGLGCCAVTTR